MSVDLLTTIVAAARRAADDARKRVQGAAVERRAAARQPRGDAFVASLRAPGHPGHRRVQAAVAVARRSAAPTTTRRRSRAATRPPARRRISVLTEPTFFDGVARPPARRSRGGRPAGPPQGLHRHRVPAARSARGWRRRGAADRRRARRSRRCARCSRTRAASRAGRAGRGARRDGAGRARSTPARRSSASTAAICARSTSSGVVLDELAPHPARGVVAVAESGLQIARPTSCASRPLGYDAFLIGERFMTRGRSRARRSRALLGVGASRRRRMSRVRVKICGITRARGRARGGRARRRRHRLRVLADEPAA